MIDFSTYAANGRAVMVKATAADLDAVQRVVPEGGGFLLNNSPPDLDHYIVDGAWVSCGDRPGLAWDFDWDTKAWVKTSDLARFKAEQVRQINAGFEAAALALTAGYPASERATWSTQQAEALAWQANASAPTPYLDNVAAARGIEPADMRAKTLENVQLFLQGSAALIGHRQRLRDQVNDATTTDAVALIVWTNPLTTTESTTP